MAQVELIMPKMGESVAEATIIKWLKSEGETIEMEESVLEIATDKVDSEVPSPVEGTLVKILFNEDDVVQVGQAVAIIETDAAAPAASPANETKEVEKAAEKTEAVVQAAIDTVSTGSLEKTDASGRFYSPLVRSMADQEGISMSELESIPGTGKDGRVTKNDMKNYLSSGRKASAPVASPAAAKSAPAASAKTIKAPSIPVGQGDEIIEMDRMRKLIADHMVMSKHVSPHVTSFVEADVTNMVNWRNGVKADFKKREGQNITFTPLFIEAVVKAIKDFPMINVSVDGTKIIKHNNINVGIRICFINGLELHVS